MFESVEEAERYIADEGIEQIDLKFCDLWGRWHHVTISAARFSDELMTNGIGFDGSSVGFKGISSGDMVMVPDLQTAFPDPFWELPTLSFICTTLEADTRKLYPYDPRSIVQRSEVWLAESGIADASLWGPEFEFYVFNGVSYENGMNTAAYRIESDEGSWAQPGNRKRLLGPCARRLPRDSAARPPPQPAVEDLLEARRCRGPRQVSPPRSRRTRPVRDRDPAACRPPRPRMPA